MSEVELALAEQLDAMAAKIGFEGLEYFLENYIDMVPDVENLRCVAEQARLALSEFERDVRQICTDHGVEYDQ